MTLEVTIIGGYATSAFLAAHGREHSHGIGVRKHRREEEAREKLYGVCSITLSPPI